MKRAPFLCNTFEMEFLAFSLLEMPNKHIQHAEIESKRNKIKYSKHLREVNHGLSEKLSISTHFSRMEMVEIPSRMQKCTSDGSPTRRIWLVNHLNKAKVYN